MGRPRAVLVRELRGFVVARGITPLSLAGLAMAWLAAVLAARIGIPHVDPALQDEPRPLETLGFLVAGVPVSLCANLLGDHMPWLTMTSPRRVVGLRLGWFGVTGVLTVVAGLAWAWCLPTGVPLGQALAVWLLLYGCAVWVTVILRDDLAVIGPVVLIAPLSVGGLIPFGWNIIYNLELTPITLAVATATLLSAECAYGAMGDGRARQDR